MKFHRLESCRQILVLLPNCSFSFIYKLNWSSCAGQVGYLISSLKDPHDVIVGDTIVHAKQLNSGIEPLPGFVIPKSMVFAGIYPIDSEDFPQLSTAVQKLVVNDASVTVQKESRFFRNFHVV